MRILFQGDSITDAGRDYSDYHELGQGYPKYAAELIRDRFDDPKNGTIEFINLGISGHRTRDLRARWQKDCIDLQPDIVSIMIGINDTWRAFDSNDPTPVEEFEDNYRYLLSEIKAHTNAKILLLEPYVLPDVPAKDAWRADLDPKIQAVRRLAREFADAYIPTDGLFAAACVQQEPSHWSGDGVHPNENGSRFIAAYYAKAVAALIED
ncbi:MAG: SGNH/GDSL hydrolase family protein [Acutalibacteraceae bacterium]|nr:SGNH/GDSL hydrolase family protein [Clostridiales bacterium]